MRSRPGWPDSTGSIHPPASNGDYHLGQVLHEVAGPEAGEGRWFVLDFEGEPLRPWPSAAVRISRCATSPEC